MHLYKKHVKLMKPRNVGLASQSPAICIRTHWSICKLLNCFPLWMCLKYQKLKKYLLQERLKLLEGSVHHDYYQCQSKAKQHCVNFCGTCNQRQKKKKKTFSNKLMLMILHCPRRKLIMWNFSEQNGQTSMKIFTGSPRKQSWVVCGWDCGSN